MKIRIEERTNAGGPYGLINKDREGLTSVVRTMDIHDPHVECVTGKDEASYAYDYARAAVKSYNHIVNNGRSWNRAFYDVIESDDGYVYNVIVAKWDTHYVVTCFMHVS